MSKRKTGSEADKPLPRCKAILLCEKIIVDSMTTQVTLVGVIDKLTVPHLPDEISRVSLYLLLVDGIGEYELALEVHDLAEDAWHSFGTPKQCEPISDFGTASVLRSSGTHW